MPQNVLISSQHLRRKLSLEAREKIKQNYINVVFKDALDAIGQQANLVRLLLQFQLDILGNLETLGHELENESDVRFAVGEPLVRLIKKFNPSYKVCTSVQCYMFPHSSMSFSLILYPVCTV